MSFVWSMSLLCTIPENPKTPLQKIDFHSQYKEYNRLPCVSHLDGEYERYRVFVETFLCSKLTQINSLIVSFFVETKGLYLQHHRQFKFFSFQGRIFRWIQAEVGWKTSKSKARWTVACRDFGEGGLVLDVYRNSFVIFSFLFQCGIDCIL